jgi:hypothetical protein
VTALAGAALVIVLDAASWVVLAVSYARIAPTAARLAEPGGPPAPAATPAATTSAWATIRSSPVLPGLLALTFVFYLLYGPIEVALPVHVATDLHGSAALLGTIWAIFGVGAAIGELSAPFLRRWPVWPVMTAIVLGWGLALVPFGLPTPLWIGLAAFTAGAVIWGPWMSLSMGVFQDASPQLAAHPGRADRHRSRRPPGRRPRRPRHPARLRPGHHRSRPGHRRRAASRSPSKMSPPEQHSECVPGHPNDLPGIASFHERIVSRAER